MKVLQLVQRNLAKLGLDVHQSTAQKYPFNGIIVKCLFIMGVALMSSFVYIFREANTFQEYAFSVNVFFTTIMVAVIYLIFIWKSHTLGRLIDSLEAYINKSELNFEFK